MQIAGSGNSKNANTKKKQIRDDLIKEQKKLEEMVLETMQKGSCNLGEDASILNQSRKLDKLIVDDMMLRENKKKRPKK